MKTRLWLVAAIAVLGAAIPATASAAPTSLGAFWHLDEAKGAAALDDSSNANHGTISGAARITGRFKRALRFDGIDDEVVVPRSPSLEPGTITVEGWVRAPSSPGTFQHIIAKGALLCEVASYALYTGPTGGLAFYVSSGSDDVLAISPMADPAIWDGAWHHIAGTYDGTAVRLYVDGAEVGTGTPANLSIIYDLPTVEGRLGAFGSGPCAGSTNFAGDLDEARIWGRAMDSTEIVASKAMGGPSTTELDEFTDSSQSVAYTKTFSSGNVVISTESATGTEQITAVKIVGVLPLLARATCRDDLLALLNSNCDIALSNGGRTASLTVRRVLFSPTVTLRVHLASGRTFTVEAQT